MSNQSLGVIMETTPVLEATVVFPLRETTGGVIELLFGKKTEKIGIDRITGPGGMREGEESIRECASRELHEEAGLSAAPESLRYLGYMTFHNHKQDEAGQEKVKTIRVHFFLAEEWYGTVTEADHGMKGFSWLKVTDLPYERMMAADVFFLPQMLQCKRREGVIGSAHYLNDQLHLYPNTEVIVQKVPNLPNVN